MTQGAFGPYLVGSRLEAIRVDSADVKDVTG